MSTRQARPCPVPERSLPRSLRRARGFVSEALALESQLDDIYMRRRRCWCLPRFRKEVARDVDRWSRLAWARAATMLVRWLHEEGE